MRLEPHRAAQRAFHFDSNRCTGCRACELACAIENGLEESWRQVVTLNPEHHPSAPTIHLSMACNHCAEPPCADACPALAYSKDPRTGRVELDAEKCIGCGYCSWACPYDAPRFDEAAGVMGKCTFCSHRGDALGPACVESCPTGALGWGELAELEGEFAMPGVPTVDPGPSIRFTAPRSPGGALCSATASSDTASDQAPPAGPRKITLAKEWPLVGFTLLAALLVGLVVASAAGALHLPRIPFAVALGASFALSTLHLGRKARAWRAVLNLRRSWLSREIFLYSLFGGLAAAHLFLPEVEALATAAAWVGLAALFAVDRVYDIVLRHAARRLHSADVLLSGFFVAALCVEPTWAWLLLALKGALYVERKGRAALEGHRRRPRWSVARLLAGGVGAILLPTATASTAIALALLALGEVADRIEFYLELEVPTPRGEMARLSRQGVSPSGVVTDSAVAASLP